MTCNEALRLVRWQADEIDRLQYLLAQRPITVEIEETPQGNESWRHELYKRFVRDTTIKVRLKDDAGWVFELSPSTVQVVIPSVLTKINGG